MKKKTLIYAAAAMLALSISACGAKTVNTETKPTSAVQTTEAAVSKPESTEAGSTSAESTESGKTESVSQEETLTGTVDVNKGFMITLISNEDSEAYVFPLDDKQAEAYKDLKSGDKVTVSYVNGLPTPDNMETVVTDIQKTK